MRAVVTFSCRMSHVQPESEKPLRVFLCHSSRVKAAVRKLYALLQSDGFDPWLDEEDILPGQDKNGS